MRPLLAPSRWPEYRAFLQRALALGWRTATLGEWAAGTAAGDRVVLLRHDVDRAPAAALRMARLERALGVRGSWYFRWGTAHPAVVRAVRDLGLPVGLHYETLTRHARRTGRAPGPEDVERCRELLAGEVAAFARAFGPAEAICPHGDTRVPGVRNGVLAEGVPPERLGVAFDAELLFRGRRIGGRAIDRGERIGGWPDPAAVNALLTGQASPLLLVVHPNNWAGTPALLADRVLARVLPDPWTPRAPAWPPRSRPDLPLHV